jgi:hypothetical protein
MNRISAIALFAAATFAAVHSASAQQILTVSNVPFAFTVNGTTLPAGSYTVRSLSSSLMEIRSNDFMHPMAVRVSAHDSDKISLNRPAELIFEAYGNQYFLHEVVSPTNSTDAVVFASKEEKKARMEWASRRGSEPVQIALK